MTETKTAAEIAERSQKRRAGVMTVFPLLFMAQQGHFYLMSHADGVGGHLDSTALRLVDKVQIGGYIFWSLALLAVLATGGGFFRGKAVRDLLSDEVTRANRAVAYAVGFWVLVLGCAGLYITSLITPLSPTEVLNVLLSLGVVMPCLTFAALERKALRG
jgi:hypothetical protein